MVAYVGLCLLLLHCCVSLCASWTGPQTSTDNSTPCTANDPNLNVTYIGASDGGVENFLNIKYGQDTGGDNRFKAPLPFSYPVSSTVNTTKPGPACPQTTTGTFFGFPSDSGIQSLSEDCLNLRIARPAGTKPEDKLPVMVWIYGGSDEEGDILNPLYNPDGLIKSSVSHDLKVIYVAMNYRVNIFGFANSETLAAEDSLNNGLKDQRLALEWIQSNIVNFGGDPSSVTLFGQSDGGTSVGLQFTAYGGKGQAPFTRAIMESGSPPADPGVSGNFTIHSTMAVARNAGCPTNNSTEMLSCLRSVNTTLLSKAVTKYEKAESDNPQDIFFPAIDGTFIPAAPSELLRQGRFYKNVPVIAGWCNNDGSLFTAPNIATAKQVSEYVQVAYPHLTSETLSQLLDLYPASDFTAEAKALGTTPQFLQAVQILTDLNFACPAYFTVQQVAMAGGMGFLYNFNQTAYARLEKEQNSTYLGVTHTSEIPFAFNEVSIFTNNTQDQHLATLVSGSWLQLAHTGSPTGSKNVVQNWPSAFSASANDVLVRVIGGPRHALLNLDQHDVFVKRCSFATNPSFFSQLQT